MSMKTMRDRLLWQGGYDTISRINRDKLRTLRLALKGDQHSRRLVTPEKECWYGLINDNKLTADYDRKILAIEKDAHLNPGDTIEVLDDGSHWLVYMPFLSETAYLRTEIIRCRYTIDIDGTQYWVYFQGPTATSSSWFIKDAVNIANMNLDGEIYLKNDEKTVDFFHRFKVIKLAGKQWEVQALDTISVPGIIEVNLKETFQDKVSEVADVLQACEADPVMGLNLVEQDGEYGYEVRGSYLNQDRNWVVEGNDRVRIKSVSEDGRFCTVRVHNGAVDGFTVKYGTHDTWYVKKVQIKCCCTPIVGPTVVYPYDVVEYKLRDSEKHGTFYVDGVDTRHAKVIEQNGNSCKVEITASKTCEFLLRCQTSDDGYFEHKVSVRSF